MGRVCLHVRKGFKEGVLEGVKGSCRGQGGCVGLLTSGVSGKVVLILL